MAIESGDYAERLAAYEGEILDFLRTLESIQEHLKLGAVKESQARLIEASGSLFRHFNSEFAALTPPEAQQEFHAKFCSAAAQLEKAQTLFMTKPDPNWTVAFLYSRRAFCRGLYELYELRRQLSRLQAYFVSEGAQTAADSELAADSSAPAGANGNGGAVTGFSHHERTETHGTYSLYVPENYSPTQKWPLVICLHGGYGAGDEYIWTWLRPARTKGYILLSPKSLGNTWSMTMNSIDTRSVMAMFDEVTRDYAIDAARIYLTGLSDGGIFTYIMGLERHELFAGIAPVAGALHMAVDPMLRMGTGKEVPLFVIHGVHDFIFPVTFTRQTNELLNQIGYNLKYEELPEWGHALPYSINETLVAPWFESLPPRPE
jgi:pimeloyl-ACP methyl ester carboxylesterase